jgi:hypothetical protein
MWEELCDTESKFFLVEHLDDTPPLCEGEIRGNNKENIIIEHTFVFYYECLKF